jgi:hypothetical protein
VLKDHKEIQVL